RRARCGEVWRFLLSLTCFAVLLGGCNNACFVFTSNPGTGTININVDDPKQTCTLRKLNGTVRVLTHTVSLCSFCSPSTRIAHLFVSLTGIEVHASAIAEDESSDWQEMVPHLADQPRQFDLVSPTSGETRLALGERVAIPADAYRLVR